MPNLNVLKANMVMRFNDLLVAIDKRKSHLEKGAVNLHQQMHDHEDDIDEETFVERTLDAMSELAKAHPEARNFLEQFETEEKRQELIKALEAKVKESTSIRLDLEEELEESIGDYWRAREKFTEAGGHCLDYRISRSVLSHYRVEVGPGAGERFADVYEAALAENGPFEKAVTESGLADQVTVVRYNRLFPQVAMTPDAEQATVDTFSRVLWENMKDQAPDHVSEDDIKNLVASNVKAINVAIEFDSVLPLKDVYIDRVEIGFKAAMEKMNHYRESRQAAQNSQESGRNFNR